MLFSPLHLYPCALKDTATIIYFQDLHLYAVSCSLFDTYSLLIVKLLIPPLSDKAFYFSTNPRLSKHLVVVSSLPASTLHCPPHRPIFFLQPHLPFSGSMRFIFCEVTICFLFWLYPFYQARNPIHI